MDRFVKHVNQKLGSIEANIRFMKTLHKFEIDRLKAQLARRKARTR